MGLWVEAWLSRLVSKRVSAENIILAPQKEVWGVQGIILIFKANLVER